eukprot:g10490.t1 g10490   contig4:1967476-1968709(+)
MPKVYALLSSIALTLDPASSFILPWCGRRTGAVSLGSSNEHTRRHRRHLSVLHHDLSSTLAADALGVKTPTSSESTWATHALLFSSWTDGVVPNNGARSFLRFSLMRKLLNEKIAGKEDSVKTSVEFSPCNGPDVDALNNLEFYDQLNERGQQLTIGDFGNNEKQTRGRRSANTPGKQRQRARADGKKRRDQVLHLFDELMTINDSIGTKLNLQAITLDLDDGSLKQPVGSYETASAPETDKDSLTTWNPHVIYVEGGNTFWLQHCIDKGNYSKLIKEACTGNDGAVYCGKSAGAIVAGSNVSTATWKGWDEPSVVPGRETYNQWMDCKGFGFLATIQSSHT